MITGFRQSTNRICRHCWKSGAEYGVIEGNPTPEQIANLRHDPKAMRDMDAHEKVCEKNPLNIVWSLGYQTAPPRPLTKAEKSRLQPWFKRLLRLW